MADSELCSKVRVMDPTQMRLGAFPLSAMLALATPAKGDAGGDGLETQMHQALARTNRKFVDCITALGKDVALACVLFMPFSDEDDESEEEE